MDTYMSIVIDILLVAVIAYCVWSGYKKGLILSISGILALVVAFYGANLIADTYSSEFVSMLKPFIGGFVDDAVTETAKEAVEDPDFYVTEGDETETYILSVESLKKLGLSQNLAESMAEAVDEAVTVAGKAVKDAIMEKLSSALANLLVFIIAFVLIMIVFAVIANLINLTFSLPGLKLLNNIGGLAFGLIKGLLIVFAVAWVLGYLGFLVDSEDTVVLAALININPLTLIFGA